MKRLSYIISLLCMVSVLLTSCLDGDNNSTGSMSGYATLRGYLGNSYFELDSGEKVYPLKASDLLELTGSRYFVFFTLQNEEQWEEMDALPKDQRVYNAQELGIALLDTPIYAVSKGAANDTVKNDPIVSIDFGWALNSRYLNLYIDYFINTTTHSIALFWYPQEGIKEGSSATVPDTLNLFLSHDKLKDNPTYGSQVSQMGTNYIALYMHSFDIYSAINEFDITHKDTIIFNINGFKSDYAGETNSKAFSYPVKVPTK